MHTLCLIERERGQWQPTGTRGHLDQLVNTLITDFGRVLTPIA